MTRRTSLRAPGLERLEDRRVFAIDRQERRLPRCRASSMTSGPATTSVSLLARATILPASRAAQVPRRPTAPTIALKTRSVSGSCTILMMPSRPARTSTPVPRSSLAASGASSGRATATKRGRCWTAWTAISLHRAWELRPHALSRAPASCSTTLMALRPIEPVEPRITTRVIESLHSMSKTIESRIVANKSGTGPVLQTHWPAASHDG